MRVVLITIDTLRYDGVATMPRLLARAKNAARFARFYASTSTTQPSHASMFTGLHPWEHGVTRNGQVLGEQFTTLAEAFARAGFETRAVVGAFPLAARFGFAQGFDHYVDEFSQGFFGVVRWSGEDVPKLKFFSRGNRVTELAMREIDGAEQARQFFWFHYFDPHSPYGSSQGKELNAQMIRAAVPEGERAVAELLAEARALYTADLEFLDGALERLFARLDEDVRKGVETHVMLVADHGESFGEDASVAHSYRLIDSQIRVPALIWSPAAAKGERRDVAGSIDVARTLWSLAGLPASDAAGGRDLTQPDSARRHVYGMRQTFKASAEAVELRLDGETVSLDGRLFYAVGSDGLIRRGNAEGLRDAGSSALLGLFRSFEAELDDRQSGEISPDVERALEQLGYLQ